MTRGNQIKWVVVVALALVLVGLAIFPKRQPEERTENALRPPVSTLDTPAAAENQAAPAASAPPAGAAAGAPSTAVAKRTQRPLDARAAARRQRVLDALAQGSAPKAAVTPGAAGPAGSSTRVYKEGTMADKVGDFGEEVAVLNRELLPLVGECYDQAHERNPKLTGMLALSVSFAHAEGVGGIIESVEPGPGNQLRDDELIECVRQSAFSIELPEPKSHGRNARFLTIPFGPAPTEDAGAAKAP